MPRGDGTGPMGMGSMTGRGAGYCNGFAAPVYKNPVKFAGRFGREFGRGCGFRGMFYATGIPRWAKCGYTANMGTNTALFDEKKVLKGQAEFLENQLQQVKKRLSSLNEEAE